MPRHVKDARIETREARRKLSVRSEPHWRAIVQGAHIGYYKGARSRAWLVRWRKPEGGYQKATLGEADDTRDADGEHVLDYRTAQQKALEQIAVWELGEPAKPLTVAAACREYVVDLRARKGNRAADEADGRLKKHLLPVLGERLLADLTTADLIGWRNSLVVEDEDEEEVRRSRDTANRMRSIAFAAFNLAFNGGRVDDDRAWRRVKPFKNVGEARKIILSDTEQQRLIDACEPGLREFALLVAWTGARPGRELTDARVRDLDPEAATLRVSGKTGERDIHLPDGALALLRRLTSGKRPNDHLLTTRGGTPWTSSLHARRDAAAVEKVGLDPETTLYALRHSYISRALKAGVPTKAVADQCGTSIAMIQRYYAKFIPSDLAKYAQKAAPQLHTDVSEKVIALRPRGS
jgi:integrase